LKLFHWRPQLLHHSLLHSILYSPCQAAYDQRTQSQFFILGFNILLRILHQGYWKNRPLQQLFKVFIYTYFATTCFGPRWPSSDGIHNYFRDVTSLQRIRCFML
jgi:hypothetical protein